MATDYLLAAVAAVLAVLLLQPRGAGDLPRQMWGWALSVTALAALVGGTFHGFRDRLPPRRAEALWRMTLLLSAVASCLLLLGAALWIEMAALRILLLVVAALKLGAASLYLWRRGRFSVITYDAGISLLLILALTVWRLFAGTIGDAGWWIVAGVAAALAGAIMQWKEWHLARHFNHNDLFHVAQMVACYLLYRGALHM
jgi:hypothetical protein